MPLYNSTFQYGDEVYITTTNQVGIIEGIDIVDTKSKGDTYRSLTEKYLVKPKEKSIYSYNWATWYTVDKLQLREPTSEELDCYKKSTITDITILYSLIDTCLDNIREGIDKEYHINLLNTYRLEVKQLLDKLDINN